MQGRRILLLFGIGLLVTAAAASLVPAPESPREGVESGEPQTAGAGSADDAAVEIAFSANSAGQPADGAERRESSIPAEPPTKTAGSGERVIVTVTSRDPGQVSLDGLGLVESVGPGTPAVFDLFTDSTGEFDVLYAPVEGGERRVGTLAVVSGDPSATATPSGG
ncbi:MAG: hypothetical protein ACR2IN_08535 [Thermoleophilaceae bacterium]|nr:hypothetical protein [Thermoleophilaceae bacterium]